jgi:hypothetical protein
MDRFFIRFDSRTARFAEDGAEEAPASAPVVPRTMSMAMPFMQTPLALEGYTNSAGNYGFDPLGFSDWIKTDYLAEAEIKHGRICMLALVGFSATDLGLRLPGEVHQVSSVAAHDVALAYGGMNQLFLWIGIFEIVSAVAINQMINESSGRMPGEFAWDPYNLMATPAKKAHYKLSEVVHCRLAMFAFSGMVTQAVLTGHSFPYV